MEELLQRRDWQLLQGTNRVFKIENISEFFQIANHSIKEKLIYDRQNEIFAKLKMPGIDKSSEELVVAQFIEQVIIAKEAKSDLEIL